MGIKGEPSTPSNPARGLVWSAIVGQVDCAGSESAFVSVADTPRETFKKHPWSIGGGGAADLKEMIEVGRERLEAIAKEMGITAVTGEDELFVLGDISTGRRCGIEQTRPLVTGDLVRDYTVETLTSVWLYDESYNLQYLSKLPRTNRLFWSYRSNINKRKRFGTPMVERGLTWYEWQELYVSKLRIQLSITFAFVATHNHFVLDRGGKVFKQSAPVIKLPANASEDDHLALLGLLNSSVACFWLKQVCHDKGNGGIGGGIASEDWERFYEFTGTKLGEFPLPESFPTDPARRSEDTPPPNPLPAGERQKWNERLGRSETPESPLSPAGRGAGGEGLLDLARRLDQLARERAACLPAALLARTTDPDTPTD
jgi:hypothetical protein